MKNVLAISFFVLLSFRVYFAEEVKWTGAQDQYWDNPNNWSNGKVPAYNDNVVIPTGTPPCKYESWQQGNSPQSIVNHGELIINTNLVTTSNFYNASDGKIHVQSLAGTSFFNLDNFTNEGKISGTSVEITGTVSPESSFQNSGTISTEENTKIFGYTTITNEVTGDISSNGKIVIMANSTGLSVINDGVIYSNSAESSVFVSAANFTNSSTGNIQTSNDIEINCTNNVSLNGNMYCYPDYNTHDHADITIKAKDITIDGTAQAGMNLGELGSKGGNLNIAGGNVTINGDVSAGNSITNDAGNTTITAKNNVIINGTVSGGTSYKIDGGDVTITAGNIVAISQTGNLEGGSSYYYENGNVTVNGKVVVEQGKIKSKGSGYLITSKLYENKFSSPTFSDSVWKLTISADSLIISGDSALAKAEVVTFVFRKLVVENLSNNIGIFGREAIVFNGIENSTADFSGNHNFNSIYCMGTGGIKIYADNVLEPTEGLANIFHPDPQVLPPDTGYVNGLVLEESIRDSSGKSGSFYVHLKNTGTANKSFNYNVTSKLGWVIPITGSTIQLAPFDWDSVLVNYNIPETDSVLTDTLEIILSVNSEQITKANSYVNSIEFIEPVPVELTSFTAELIAGNVLLRWRTATELNNKGFEIERKNISQKESWELNAYVGGAGTTSNPQNYSFLDKKIEDGETYCYRLKQIDYNGSYYYSNEVEIKTYLPYNFSLSQNFPNPFNPTTNIKYEVPQKGFITIKVFNVLGKEITRLVNEEKPVGSYEIIFDGNDLPSGIYFYNIQSGNFNSTRKFILLK